MQRACYLSSALLAQGTQPPSLPVSGGRAVSMQVNLMCACNGTLAPGLDIPILSLHIHLQD